MEWGGKGEQSSASVEGGTAPAHRGDWPQPARGGGRCHIYGKSGGGGGGVPGRPAELAMVPDAVTASTWEAERVGRHQECGVHPTTPPPPPFHTPSRLWCGATADRRRQSWCRRAGGAGCTAAPATNEGTCPAVWQFCRTAWVLEKGLPVSSPATQERRQLQGIGPVISTSRSCSREMEAVRGEQTGNPEHACPHSIYSTRKKVEGTATARLHPTPSTNTVSPPPATATGTTPTRQPPG